MLSSALFVLSQYQHLQQKTLERMKKKEYLAEDHRDHSGGNDG